MKTIYYKNNNKYNNNYIINNNLNNNIQNAGSVNGIPPSNPHKYIIDKEIERIYRPYVYEPWEMFILKYNIIAFYGDEYKNKWPTIDQIYNAEYLGNFYPHIMEMKLNGKIYIFPNSEAAFHASKYSKFTLEQINTILTYKNKNKETLKYDMLKYYKINVDDLMTKLDSNTNVLVYLFCNMNESTHYKMITNKILITGNVTIEINKKINFWIEKIEKNETLKSLTYNYGFESSISVYTDPSSNTHNLSSRVLRMILVLRIKFILNSPNANKLLSTGNRYLLEYNMGYASDSTWSDGKDGYGFNLLGICLMIIRDELKIARIKTFLPLKNISNYKRCIDYYIPLLNDIKFLHILSHDEKEKQSSDKLYESYDIMVKISKMVQTICHKIDNKDLSIHPPTILDNYKPFLPIDEELLYNWNNIYNSNIRRMEN
uniref:NADAR domain-containing protein n=1 Tax=viral metagenome TaxID=1070528 RepID=A0A6C0H988_9ZZZZ